MKNKHGTVFQQERQVLRTNLILYVDTIAKNINIYFLWNNVKLDKISFKE